jgi:hypothetical protein
MQEITAARKVVRKPAEDQNKSEQLGRVRSGSFLHEQLWSIEGRLKQKSPLDRWLKLLPPSPINSIHSSFIVVLFYTFYPLNSIEQTLLQAIRRKS